MRKLHWLSQQRGHPGCRSGPAESPPLVRPVSRWYMPAVWDRRCRPWAAGVGRTRQAAVVNTSGGGRGSRGYEASQAAPLRPTAYQQHPNQQHKEASHSQKRDSEERGCTPVGSPLPARAEMRTGLLQPSAVCLKKHSSEQHQLAAGHVAAGVTAEGAHRGTGWGWAPSCAQCSGEPPPRQSHRQRPQHQAGRGQR